MTTLKQILRRVHSATVVERRERAKRDRENIKLRALGKWEWNNGVKVFVGPEVKCPGCSAGVQTDRIWVTRERTNAWTLEKVWGWDGTPSKKFESTTHHPHVSRGIICRGNATSVEEALWVGLNGDSSYVDVWEWLEWLGHDCVNRVNEDEAWCPRCGENFENDDDFRYSEYFEETMCESCFDNSHYTCEQCGDPDGVDSDDWRYPNNDGPYCTWCYERLYSYCGTCEAEVLRGDMSNVSGECQECFDKREAEERDEAERLEKEDDDESNN